MCHYFSLPYNSLLITALKEIDLSKATLIGAIMFDKEVHEGESFRIDTPITLQDESVHATE